MTRDKRAMKCYNFTTTATVMFQGLSTTFRSWCCHRSHQCLDESNPICLSLLLRNISFICVFNFISLWFILLLLLLFVCQDFLFLFFWKQFIHSFALIKLFHRQHGVTLVGLVGRWVGGTVGRSVIDTYKILLPRLLCYIY